MKHASILIIALFLLSGCDIKEREHTLKERELAVATREQQVALREQSLKLKEAEIKRQAQRLDSTLNDTALIYVPELVGRWQVKMTCSETTCHGSAVGDTKLEVWDIYYSSRRIIAKVMEGKKLVRAYSGRYREGQLELTEEVDMSPGIPTTQMHVRLTLTDPETMDGQREIVRQGDCKILYALQLKKQIS